MINRRPDQKVFEKGWMNRLKQVEDNANSMITNGFYTPSYANSITPFDEEYSGELKRVDNLDSYERERLKNKYQYLLNKSSIPTGGAAPMPVLPHQVDYSGYLNPATGDGKIFSREAISQMSVDEYAGNESAIMAQLKTIGIPHEAELEEASITRGGLIYVRPYTRSDGTEVSGYWRSRPGY